MALLPILIAPDPRLKSKAKPVAAVTEDIIRLIDDMLETMYRAPGIGLAAPQVGVALQIVVIDIADKGEAPAPLRMVNPEIVWASDHCRDYEEGCLSLPEYYEPVSRPESVKVRYLDETGAEKELLATDLLAVVIQHELDHLKGTLFVDHISALKRNLILRKLTKAKKNGDFDPQ